MIIEKHELYLLKPKQLLSSLRDRDDILDKYIPQKKQLASFAASLRKKIVEQYVKNNQESLEKFIEDHSFNKASKDTDLICISSDLRPDTFLLIMSSKALLQNIIHQNESYGKNYFYTDATYKLLLNGFTLLTLGTENKNHNFKLIACAISSHEDGRSYETFFSKIKETLHLHYNFTWEPSF